MLGTFHTSGSYFDPWVTIYGILPSTWWIRKIFWGCKLFKHQILLCFDRLWSETNLIKASTMVNDWCYRCTTTVTIATILPNMSTLSQLDSLSRVQPIFVVWVRTLRRDIFISTLDFSKLMLINQSLLYHIVLFDRNRKETLLDMVVNFKVWVCWVSLRNFWKFRRLSYSVFLAVQST